MGKWSPSPKIRAFLPVFVSKIVWESAQHVRENTLQMERKIFTTASACDFLKMLHFRPTNRKNEREFPRSRSFNFQCSFLALCLGGWENTIESNSERQSELGKRNEARYMGEYVRGKRFGFFLGKSSPGRTETLWLLFASWSLCSCQNASETIFFPS